MDSSLSIVPPEKPSPRPLIFTTGTPTRCKQRAQESALWYPATPPVLCAYPPYTACQSGEVKHTARMRHFHGQLCRFFRIHALPEKLPSARRKSDNRAECHPSRPSQKRQFLLLSACRRLFFDDAIYKITQGILPSDRTFLFSYFTIKEVNDDKILSAFIKYKTARSLPQKQSYFQSISFWILFFAGCAADNIQSQNLCLFSAAIHRSEGFFPRSQSQYD